MTNSKRITIAAQFFIACSAISLLSISLMAFFNPQSVMNLVQVQLPNNDALSSIRGVYGGVGLTIFISLFYLMLKNVNQGLVFLIMLWGFYAISRAITIAADGPLGDFGKQWLMIESVFFGMACMLFLLRRFTYETK